MRTIHKDNVYRIVTEAAFNAHWRGLGFKTVKSETSPANEQVADNEGAESQRCPDPDGCEDALRARLDELGVKHHHFKGKERLQAMIDEAEAKLANGENVNAELDALKAEAKRLGLRVSNMSTVNSLRKRIVEVKEREEKQHGGK